MLQKFVYNLKIIVLFRFIYNLKIKKDKHLLFKYLSKLKFNNFLMFFNNLIIKIFFYNF